VATGAAPKLCSLATTPACCRWHHIPCGHDLGPPAPTGKFVYNLYTNWQANMSSDRLDCRWHHIPCGHDLGPPAPTGKFVYNLYTNWQANMSSDRLVAGGITSLVAMIWARLRRQGNLCTICTQIGKQICQVTG
jgi:hypothetical protein